MSFQRDLWRKRFWPDQPPQFPCPSCGDQGFLEHVPYSTRIEETSYSKLRSARAEGYSTARFISMLQCNNKVCGEIVAVHGITDLVQVPLEDLRIEERQILQPKGMYPAPPIIRVTREIPLRVLTKLRLAFELYWVDLDACANAIRSSVERILDEMKIPPGNLQNRIEAFKKIDPQHAETFDALRYVGNVGSHAGNVSRETVLDAFEIYDDTLRKLFYGEDRIGTLRRGIIARKGR